MKTQQSKCWNHGRNSGQKHGGCPFCQKTVPVTQDRRGRYSLAYHNDWENKTCEGSNSVPEGITK